MAASRLHTAVAVNAALVLLTVLAAALFLRAPAAGGPAQSR
ncbi:hypothetical protein [Streptomyces sp. NPDC047130]